MELTTADSFTAHIAAGNAQEFAQKFDFSRFHSFADIGGSVGDACPTPVRSANLIPRILVRHCYIMGGSIGELSPLISTGTAAMCVARAHPHLRCSTHDLPNLAPGARAYLQEHGSKVEVRAQQCCDTLAWPTRWCLPYMVEWMAWSRQSDECSERCLTVCWHQGM